MMSGQRHSRRGDARRTIANDDDGRRDGGEALEGGGGVVHPEEHYVNETAVEVAVPYASYADAHVHGQSPSGAAAPSFRIHASPSPPSCVRVPVRA